MAKYLDYAGLQELVVKINEKFAPIQAIQYRGSVEDVASLPSLATTPIGSMYNIVDEDVTTSDFVEGAGKKIEAGSNVIAVNTELDPAQPAIMKWDLASGIINVDDRLQFGTAMPVTDLTDGRTFLYLGEDTFEYNAVVNPTGNPQEKGYYVEDGSGGYELTTDTTVQSGTTYYTKDAVLVKGIIYKYDLTNTEWVAQNEASEMIPILNSEIDALFA
jgi:hypothetical protein